MKQARIGGVATLASLALLMAAGSGRAAGDDLDGRAEPVRIGMVNTLFRDTPTPVVSAMMQPFSAVMQSQTGVPGRLMPGGDAAQLGNLLAEDKVQIAVFHGVEFGWARQKHPDLRPLMIAVNQKRHLQALIVVREGCEAASLADLKGKSFAVARHTREHCHLFLERACQECGQDAAKFFAAVTAPATAEDALDDVVDGIVPATLVDAVSFDCYQRRKPGRCVHLKVIQRSEVFPASVVAYRPGVLDEDILERFRAGLINANKGTLGRQFLTLWKLTGFEAVPADYEQTLADILKTYPHPTPAAQPTK